MIKVGLVGRYNVGKSLIFNRLLGQYRAIVTDIKGTTREIFSEKAEIDEGKKVILLDSPGLEEEQEYENIKKIIDEADILLFVVDGKQGLTPQDEKIKDYIFRKGKDKNTILVVNKLDSKVYTEQAYPLMSEFYSLGIEPVIPLSAKQNEGFEDLKDAILKKAKELNLNFEDDEIEDLLEEIPIAIVGRPNTGKSTLLNTICGEEVAKVEDKHGTTLDYIKCEIISTDKRFVLYDTAGIRRKGKIHGLEKIAYSKTLKLLEFKKPVSVVLIDLYEGLTHRDLTIIGDLQKLNVPLIVAVNKIDLLSPEEFKNKLNLVVKSLHFAKRIPILPISAKTGKGINQLFDWILKIYKEYSKRVSTGQLNKALQTERLTRPPRFPKNKICKFYYATQVDVKPPQFVFFVNKKNYVNFAFKRWLENVIRKNFGFIGSPLVFEFKDKQESKS